MRGLLVFVVSLASSSSYRLPEEPDGRNGIQPDGHNGIQQADPDPASSTIVDLVTNAVSYVYKLPESDTGHVQTGLTGFSSGSRIFDIFKNAVAHLEVNSILNLLDRITGFNISSLLGDSIQKHFSFTDGRQNSDL